MSVDSWIEELAAYYDCLGAETWLVADVNVNIITCTRSQFY